MLGGTLTLASLLALLQPFDAPLQLVAWLLGLALEPLRWLAAGPQWQIPAPAGWSVVLALLGSVLMVLPSWSVRGLAACLWLPLLWPVTALVLTLQLILQLLDDQENAAEPRQMRLYRLLKSAILDGLLSPGTRLPGSRQLATDQRMARNCVLFAYQQLLAEGFLEADRGGTRVAALPLTREPAVPKSPRPAATTLSQRARHLPPAVRGRSATSTRSRCSRRALPKPVIRARRISRGGIWASRSSRRGLAEPRISRAWFVRVMSRPVAAIAPG